MRSLFFISTIVLLGAACAENGQPSNGIDSVAVATHSLTLSPQETFALTAQAFGVQGVLPPGTIVTWRSADTTIASVSDSGVVSAKVEGNVTLIGKAESESATVALRVVRSFARLDEEASGYLTTCAARPNGDTYCWGDHNGSADHTVPVLLGGGHQFTQISIDAEGLCGVDVAGAGWCWGGQNIGSPPTGGVGPQRILTDSVWLALSMGEEHGCGITAAHIAKCWGPHKFGDIGDDGLDEGSSSPVPVSGALQFASIKAAEYFTCGLTTNGHAYCWGSGREAELGNGQDTADVSHPDSVHTDLTFTQISSTIGSCALTAGGQAWCWGDNPGGSLGTADASEHVLTPSPVNGGLTFTEISVGWGGIGETVCGVTGSGDGYCWGDNTGGRLGSPVVGTATTPTLIAGHHKWSSIAAGATTCGLTPGGAIYCWGDSWLGNGSPDGTTSTTPVRVTDP